MADLLVLPIIPQPLPPAAAYLNAIRTFDDALAALDSARALADTVMDLPAGHPERVRAIETLAAAQTGWQATLHALQRAEAAYTAEVLGWEAQPP